MAYLNPHDGPRSEYSEIENESRGLRQTKRKIKVKMGLQKHWDGVHCKYTRSSLPCQLNKGYVIFPNGLATGIRNPFLLFEYSRTTWRHIDCHARRSQ